MPFCPSCNSEYQDGVRACAECGTSLVAKIQRLTLDDDTTDLYVCWDGQQLERVVGILREEGIDVLVRDRSSSSFPSNAGESNKQIVAVPTREIGAARKLLETAITDGVISGDGEMIG